MRQDPSWRFRLEFFEAILLGIIQGLTEFLPLSSSGHLVIVQNLLNFKESGIIFEVAVHVGTLLSIFTIYFKILRSYLHNFVEGVRKVEVNSSLRLTFLLVVGSLPTAVIGLGFKDFFEKMFDSTFAVGICLCVTGILLYLTKFKRSSSTEGAEELAHIDLSIAEKISVKQAIIMGFAQGLAIMPGVSRAGSTISAGILSGIEKNTAATFSFIMSVPAILGAAALELRHLEGIQPNFLILLVIGVISSYLTGLLGLYLVLKVVKKGRIEIFSYYLWIVGPLTMIFLGGR